MLCKEDTPLRGRNFNVKLTIIIIIITISTITMTIIIIINHPHDQEALIEVLGHIPSTLQICCHHMYLGISCASFPK